MEHNFISQRGVLQNQYQYMYQLWCKLNIRKEKENSEFFFTLSVMTVNVLQIYFSLIYFDI